MNPPTNFDSQAPSSGENTAKIVPEAAVDARFQFNEAAYPPGDLGGGSASKRGGSTSPGRRQEGNDGTQTVAEDAPAQQPAK